MYESRVPNSVRCDRDKQARVVVEPYFSRLREPNRESIGLQHTLSNCQIPHNRNRTILTRKQSLLAVFDRKILHANTRPARASPFVTLFTCFQSTINQQPSTSTLFFFVKICHRPRFALIMPSCWRVKSFETNTSRGPSPRTLCRAEASLFARKQSCNT